MTLKEVLHSKLRCVEYWSLSDAEFEDEINDLLKAIDPLIIAHVQVQSDVKSAYEEYHRQ